MLERAARSRCAVETGPGCNRPGASRQSRGSERVETRLDEFRPGWQFNELHTIRIAASPARVMTRSNMCEGRDLPVRPADWIRRGGGRFRRASSTPISQ